MVGGRSASITPVQSLLLMNSEQVMRQAEGMARRLSGRSAEEKIVNAWKMACCRAPTVEEQEMMQGFLRSVGDTPGGWAQLCHALMQSGEFQVVY